MGTPAASAAATSLGGATVGTEEQPESVRDRPPVPEQELAARDRDTTVVLSAEA